MVKVNVNDNGSMRFKLIYLHEELGVSYIFMSKIAKLPTSNLARFVRGVDVTDNTLTKLETIIDYYLRDEWRWLLDPESYPDN